MTTVGGAAAAMPSEPWSSPAVQMTATLENYVPGVHHSGNGAPHQEAVHGNGAANGHMSDFEDEQARLRAEIAAANARTVAARERIAVNEEEGRTALREELEATRSRLAEMERVHRDAVTMVRESARLEVERILTEAHQEAAAIRDGNADVERPANSDVE